MNQLEKWLIQCEEVLMTIATIIMVLMVFIQVCCRYFLEVSLHGTEELARYMMIMGTFLGAALAAKNRGHIKLELRHLFHVSAKTRQVWDVFIDCVAIGSLAVLAYYLYQALPDWSDMSAALRIPMVLPIGSVFVGILLMILHYILLCRKNIKQILE
jgi:TRAP-type C4-dicarboxylate transport system permease small subunit